MTSPPAPPVADDELLYRRVPAGCYARQPDGTLLILSVAFADRAFRPSVDRAALRGHDPRGMVAAPTDGVVGVVAADVRATDSVDQRDAKGQLVRVLYVDVEPVPLPENPAHAEIFVRPDCPTQGVFRKLCNRLARLANERAWAVRPGVTSDE